MWHNVIDCYLELQGGGSEMLEPARYLFPSEWVWLQLQSVSPRCKTFSPHKNKTVNRERRSDQARPKYLMVKAGGGEGGGDGRGGGVKRMTSRYFSH